MRTPVRLCEDGEGFAVANDTPTMTDGARPSLAVARAVAAEGLQTLRARTIARGTIWQETYIRDFPPRSTAADREGLSLSADDLASNPMEDLLAALGACLTRSIHANALARNILIKHVETNVEADMHRSGRWWGSDRVNPIGFETIKVFVRIDAEAPKDALADLVRTTALWSPVANTLFNAVHLDVRLADDPPSMDGDGRDGLDGWEQAK